MPKIKEYITNDIICATGIYKCDYEKKATTWGIHVEFTAYGSTIELETFCLDSVLFPSGTYSAKVYYTPNSKILLSLCDLEKIAEEK